MAYRKSARGGLSPAARITQEITARFEAGTKPWIKPWRGVPVSRPLRACGTPYRGMNVFWLWMVADMGGYTSPFWMTYNQATKLGGQVRKGETSTIAIFYKSYTREVEPRGTGEPCEEARRVLKAYPVFNADQIDGLPEHFHPAATLELVEPEGRERELDAFFAAIPAQLRHQGDEAYYESALDRITMPSAHLFSGMDHYYATLAHELSHWTGTPRYKRKPMERYLSPREYGQLANALRDLEDENPFAVAAIRLLVYTGARRGEIEKLRWEWTQPPRLMLPDSKTGAKVLYLNRQAVELIEGLPNRRSQGLVFPSSRNPDAPVNLTSIWIELRNHAALPDVRLHDLRHSFASTAIRDNISLMVIGKLLCHALAETTSRYAHLSDEIVADAAERVSGSIARLIGVGR